MENILEDTISIPHFIIKYVKLYSSLNLLPRLPQTFSFLESTDLKKIHILVVSHFNGNWLPSSLSDAEKGQLQRPGTGGTACWPAASH